MAPLTPHWARPSHPDIQNVIINDAEFTSKSLSKVTLAPFAVFAKMAFPPCTLAEQPTYATVQIGRNKHLNLNSDLLYINHSCEPSLVSRGPLRIFLPLHFLLYPLPRNKLCRLDKNQTAKPM